MLPPQIEIIIIASIIAVACALPGTFLVLRKVSLMSDAISHAILLGIVVAFFLVKDVTSPFLIIGAALTGVLTVTFTELLIKTRKIKEDASIGIVFPVLFSIAVILISKYASNAHIDTDTVLLGELAFAPFNRFTAFGIDLGPHALWLGGVILILNAAFIILFYKELKISTFDASLATTLGFAPGIVHYGLMSLVSVTAVASFDAVGSILVVALMIAPPAAAYMWTKRLPRLLALASGFGVLSALSGYAIAHAADASIAGSMAMMTGVIFIISLLASPDKGLISQAITHTRRKVLFASQMLVVHLLAHEGTPEEQKENTLTNARKHMNWNPTFTRQIVSHSVELGWVQHKGDSLKLTNLGREEANQVMTFT